MAEAAFNMIAETQRLRDAGLPHGQAEAVTLAIHAGVTGGVATKADLEALRGRADVLDTKIDSLGDRLDTKIDSLGDRLDARIDSLGDRLDARIDGLGDRLDARIDGLDTELKWIKAIGGVIVAILVLPWLAGILGVALPGP